MRGRGLTAAETNFTANNILAGIGYQGVKKFTILAKNKIIERDANEFFKRNIENFGKTSVGVKNGAVVGQRGGALVDSFDHQPVGMFGALQSKNLVTFGTRNQHGVDFAHADSSKSFFQLGHTSAQSADLRGTSGTFFPLGHRYCCPTLRSRPRMTRAVSEKSPTSLRSGNGMDLMSVGAAMI